MARILVVENSSFLKGALTFLLENAGHVVVGTATNLQEALQLFQARKPAIVTVDLLMGGLDGLPIIRALMQADPAAKIVVVSVFGQEAKLAEARRLGTIGAISKPYKYQEIVDEIRKVLAGPKG